MKQLSNLVFLFAYLSFSASPAFAFQSDDPAVVANRLPAVVELTDGSSVEGNINSFTEADVELSVSEDSAETLNLSFKQISGLDFETPNADTVLNNLENQAQGVVALVDGSQVYLGEISIQNGVAKITTVAGVSIEANVSHLRTISFLGSEPDNEQKQQWANLIDGTLPTSDAIIVSKNGTLQLIEGIVGDISDQHLTFSMESRTAEVALEKIRGVVFYRAERELIEPMCLLTLADASKFQIRKVDLDRSNLNLTTIGGLQFTIDTSQIRRMDFSAGRSVFLSDLIPSTNTWTPLLASSEILEPLKALRIAKFNTDFRGQPLTLSNTPESGLSYLVETIAFEKGIAISGGGRVVFALNKQFKRLSGLVGFQPKTHPSSVVRFVVKTDGQTAISEAMRADETFQPIALDLDVSSTNRISFAVEYEDGRSAGDILHLVDFKVSR